MKKYVIDTNIILDNTENLFKVYNFENEIIIPETVLDEVDSFKSDLTELGFQSREFSRILNDMIVAENHQYSGYTITKLKSNDLELTLISKEKYKSDNQFNKNHNIQADRRIIEIAKDFNATLISLDTLCRLRAISEGVNAESFGKNEDKHLDFIKTIEIDNFTQNQDILELDPDYKKFNFCYILKLKNGDCKLATIKNQRIQLIDENDLNKQDIKPLNIGQKFFVSGILDTFDIIISEAIAGSGKTLLSLSSAMRLINEKKYSKIYYIRNSIESLDKGEDIGYLAGNDEKFAIYNHPLYDNIEFIARTQLNKSNNNKSKKSEISEQIVQEKIQELIKRYSIETIWPGSLRGRTLSNGIVIIDECLHKDQKIKTNKGLLSAAEIEKLILNNEWVDVESINLKTGQKEQKRLLTLKKEKIHNTNEKMYKIDFDDGSSIMVTGHHKLLQDCKFKTVEELKEMLEMNGEVEIDNFK